MAYPHPRHNRYKTVDEKTCHTPFWQAPSTISRVTGELRKPTPRAQAPAELKTAGLVAE